MNDYEINIFLAKIPTSPNLLRTGISLDIFNKENKKLEQATVILDSGATSTLIHEDLLKHMKTAKKIVIKIILEKGN